MVFEERASPRQDNCVRIAVNLGDDEDLVAKLAVSLGAHPVIMTDDSLVAWSP